jgi:hypothetical protein
MSRTNYITTLKDMSMVNYTIAIKSFLDKVIVSNNDILRWLKMALLLLGSKNLPH